MDKSSLASYEKSAKGQIRRPTRPEHVIAFEFLKIHFEEDRKAETPIQKSDVYNEYQVYCKQNNYKPLVAADFGRILKSMFPDARDRRLGSRGSSKYCYVGIRHKSDLHTQNAQNLCSAEDLCNAYQTVVCEWASTVLNRKLSSLEELAKFLLRNRQVQTRTCAALTITANLKDTDELFTDIQPMNKHRETQIKLQEKLRERLLIKSRHNSTEDTTPDGILSSMHGHHQTIDSAFSSTSTTPDPEGMLRQAAMQICSAPGSSRASPINAMSVNSSACTSPVHADHVLSQQHMNYIPSSIDYQNNCHSFDGHNNNRMQSGIQNMQQCNTPGSGRTTPAIHSYYPVPPVPIPYDHRIHSAPATPHPGYQANQRFDFSQPPSVASQQQCMSLPNSARNTPVNDMQQDANYTYGAAAGSSQQYPQSWDGASQSLSNNSEQRLEFGKSNSAFIPVKDPSEMTQYNMVNYPSSGNSDIPTDDRTPHNNEDYEINQLLSIIGQQEGPMESMVDNSFQQQQQFDRRPASVQEPFASTTAPTSQRNGGSSVIYSLLTSKNPTERIKQRYRHHSGPQLGYSSAARTQMSAMYENSASSVDLNSPPSTPNGKFRPVTTPNTEIRMNIGNKVPSRCMPMSYQNHLSMNVVGTMSPPAQPLNKRRRQNSGDPPMCSPQCSPAAMKISEKTGSSSSPEYLARRNLGVALESPCEEVNNSRQLDQQNGSLADVLTTPSVSVSTDEQRSV